ncbi:TetR/AcrR family transcriptional regulator [Bordetella muralis]|jgi:AcrR family transcriptional regulator|uniref:TetR/AcrR family transcriptional regulator n=1 Tax=Bordetella muralis TaxID=1649130 RepID=UPI0039EFE2D7
MNEIASSSAGQRGPADHDIRDQIVAAANKHFGHFGYAKTTVSDLAKAIGFSKAYIYKFFDSKQAIGEAICSQCLGTVLASVHTSVAEGKSATDKFRRLFQTLVARTSELFFNDRQLYEVAAYSSSEGWQSSRNYEEQIRGILLEILREGRESGEFERKTPLDETARAIFLVMQPFVKPLLLQHNLDLIDEAPKEIAGLVLRSLAP